MTTMQIDWPEWQGGMNPNYRIGNEILRAIVPTQASWTKFLVPVSQTAESSGVVDGDQELLDQQAQVRAALANALPRRVITLGGDCAVSAVPFDYLHGQYPDDFGVIWLDAHPDISTVNDSHHFHEMVVSNLLKVSHSVFDQDVEQPLQPNQVFFAGLVETDLRPMDRLVKDLNMAFATPKQLENGSPIKTWLVQNGIKHVAVHWDLDVLDPDDFKSILPAQPHLDRSQFGAAIGTMTLENVIKLLSDLGTDADLVGLTIAEHMPWDAIRLRQGLGKLPIFKG